MSLRKLPKPTEDPRALLIACANDYSQLRTAGLRTRLLNSVAAVAQAAVDYDHAAAGATLHTMPQSNTVDGPSTATCQDMINAYESKVAKSGKPGRALYERLMMLPPGGKCPLCGTRNVAQLDHHLPKTKYPAFALLPVNLVASCSDCNTGKTAKSPQSSAEETMHPYYDDYTTDKWLYADVVAVSPPALTFSVRAPTNWTALKRARAEHHLSTLGLARLFAIEAADHLVSIRGQLIAIGQRGGAAGIQQFLDESAASRRAVHLNSWQTATYDALVNSAWFCSIGYSMIA